jgi:phosphoglycolate phosphatase
MSKYNLIVFDWDGTLMDSQARIITSMQTAIAEFDIEPRSSEQIRNIIGLGLEQAIIVLYPELSAPQNTELANCYRNHFFDANALASPLFPGAIELLQDLHSKNYSLAVATGKGRRGLNEALEQNNLANFFHSTVCAEETASKPDPLMLQEIMEELDFSAEQTVMIGDSEYDLEMANNAKVASIAVSFGVHDKSRLLQYKPLTCIDSLSELSQFI